MTYFQSKVCSFIGKKLNQVLQSFIRPIISSLHKIKREMFAAPRHRQPECVFRVTSTGGGGGCVMHIIHASKLWVDKRACGCVETR